MQDPWRYTLPLLACLGCVGSDFRFVELPANEETNSVLVSRQTPEETTHELHSVRDFVLQSHLEDEGTLFLSFFSETPTELGLSEGRVTPAPANACQSRPLPRPVAMFRLDGDVLVAADERRDVVSFSVELPCPCRELELSSIELDPKLDTASLEALVPWGRGQLLVTAQQQHTAPSALFIYDDSTRSLREVAEMPIGSYGCSADGKTAFISSTKGRLFRFDEENGAVEVEGTDAIPAIDGLGCTTSTSGPEVFVLAGDGKLHHFDGTRWSTPLDELTEFDAVMTNKPALVALAPDRVVFMQDSGATLFYLDGDRARRVPWSTNQILAPDKGPVEDIRFSDEGLVMLTRLNNVLIDPLVNGEWSLALEPPVNPEQIPGFEDLIDDPGGLFFISNQSAIWEYNYAADRYCEPTRAPGEIRFDRFVRLNDRVLFASGNSVEGNNAPSLVRIAIPD